MIRNQKLLFLIELLAKLNVCAADEYLAKYNDDDYSNIFCYSDISDDPDDDWEWR